MSILCSWTLVVEYQNRISFYLWKVRKQVEQDKFCMSTQKNQTRNWWQMMRIDGLWIKNGGNSCQKRNQRKWKETTINIPLEHGKESKQGMIMVKVDRTPFER